MMISAFNQAIDNIKNKSSVVWSGIATTSFSLVMLGSLLLIYLNVIHITQKYFQQSHYSVFLQQDIESKQKKVILNAISGIEGAYGITEIASEQSRQELLNSLGEAGKLIEKVTFSKLPDIIEFSLKRTRPLTDPELSQLASYGGIENIVSGRETKEQIDVFFFTANFVGIFLIVILIISIAFIIRNSIQIGIRIRLKEIEILQVLGATKWFIRMPYIIEGVFIAIVSFFLSLSIIYFLFQFAIAGITYNEATYGIENSVRFFPVLELGFILIGLVLLGILSSVLATDSIIKQLES